MSNDNYTSICKAITLLFPGQIEVIIHDLASGKISHIESGFSNRAIGDDSLIDVNELTHRSDNNNVIGPYAKSNSNGEPLKSISTIIRDEHGQPIRLLCINMKITAFKSAMGLFASLIDIDPDSSNETQALISEDWREQANDLIAQTLHQQGVSMVQAKKADKIAIISALDRASIFQIRGSSNYISQALGISRASLYNLLKQVRHPQP